MGAQHGLTLGSKIQHVGEDTVGLNRNATKINVVQPPAGPNQNNVWGRGISASGTTYPINPIIDDRGTVSVASIDVVIPDPRHHYTKMSLNNANPTINLIDLIVGLSSTFTLDLTNAVALGSLTFSPGLINAPTLNLGNGQRNVLYIVGHRTSTETRYEVISGAGSGGISFPIIPPVSVRGNVSTTQNIDLSATNAHSTTMTLTTNISITFSNFPTTANQIEWEVEIKQDATGSRTVTWPAAVTPTPVLDSAANATTIVVLRTNDNGTIIRTLTSAGGGGDASLWANFPAVTNIDANNNDILKVKNIDMDDANSTIQGIKTLQFFDDGVNKTIGSTANTIDYKIPALESHDFYVGATKVLTINEDVATVFELDMIAHRIGNIGDLFFDLTTGNLVINRFSMEWDAALGANGSARINVPSNGEFRFQDNGVDGIIFTPFAALGYEIKDVFQVRISDGTVFPTANGDIARNGADVYIFSGGVARNMSTSGGEVFTWTADHSMATFKLTATAANNVILNAPTGQSVEIQVAGVNEYNFGATQADFQSNQLIDVNGILPTGDGSSNLGSGGNEWSQLFFRQANFGIGGTITSANRIIADSGGMVYQALGTGSHGFFSNSAERFQIQEDGTLHWVQSGRQHDIVPQATALDIIAEQISDSVQLWTGGSRTNVTVKVETLKTTFFTENNNIGAYVIQLVQNNDTPANFRTLANIDIIAENSISVDTIYARISASSNNITSGLERGLLQLGVVSGGTLISGIDIEGSTLGGANNALIGFFGETPVAQQSVASDTLANLYTALRNLGLIV